jgi:hypothetical protein
VGIEEPVATIAPDRQATRTLEDTITSVQYERVISQIMKQSGPRNIGYHADEQRYIMCKAPARVAIIGLVRCGISFERKSVG